MLILVETAAGYSLFTVDKKRASSASYADLVKSMEDGPTKSKMIQLHAHRSFKNNKEALEDMRCLTESSIGPCLKKFIKKVFGSRQSKDDMSPVSDSPVVRDLKALKETNGLVDVLVSDKTLASNMKQKFGGKMNPVFSPNTLDISKAIKSNLTTLLEELTQTDMQKMRVGLSHSLSRFKLKFSPDKIDIMIVQAVGLLDDLDKDLNNYAMRLKEWYGWHFPELANIITDNALYAEAVLAIGYRANVVDSTVLKSHPILGLQGSAEDADQCQEGRLYREIAQASKISMGTEITEDDKENIFILAQRLLSMSAYRSHLTEYLKTRMTALAPNLTYLVGEIVGARLIARAGTLMSLAKLPGSTIQILGAEKALFRALKTKGATPKYGLIYHSSLVGQAPIAAKGKISRVLGAKLALCCRYDALAPSVEPSIGVQCKNHVERKLLDCADAGNRKNNKHAQLPNIQPFDNFQGPFAQNVKTYDQSFDVSQPTDSFKKRNFDNSNSQSSFKKQKRS